jgi:hypothetical protein
LFDEVGWNSIPNEKCNNCKRKSFIPSPMTITYDGINCTNVFICNGCMPTFKTEIKKDYFMIKEYLPTLVYAPNQNKDIVQKSLSEIAPLLQEYDSFLNCDEDSSCDEMEEEKEVTDMIRDLNLGNCNNVT